jgi:hypothetical protein
MQDSLHIPHHLVVPESKHQKALSSQERGSRSVLLSLGRMMAAVDLDNDHPLRATEVHDVRPDRVLAPELRLDQSPAT